MRQLEQVGLVLPLEVTREIVRRFGEQSPAQTAGEIREILFEKAKEFAKLKERLAQLTGDDPRVHNLRSKASSLISAGDFVGAEGCLAQAEQFDLEALEESEKIVLKKRISASQTRGVRGAAADLRLAYREAATHYLKAAEIVETVENKELKLKWLEAAAVSFCLQGEIFYDQDALRKSIETYENCLVLVDASKPLELAVIQSGKAVALSIVGNRQENVAILREAETACNNALQIYNIDVTPIDWARAQGTLSGIQWKLGNLLDEKHYIKEAIETMRKSLSVVTRESGRIWIILQGNLGNALLSLGNRDGDPDLIRESIDAFRKALHAQGTEHDPRIWGRTNASLGSALTCIGQRVSGITELEEAVCCLKNALSVHPRECFPNLWAEDQKLLGSALHTLSFRASGTETLERAVEAHRCALLENTRNRNPVEWAQGKFGLGSALSFLATRTPNDAILLEEARQCFLSALEVLTEEIHPESWASIQNALGLNFVMLGQMRDESTVWRRAVEAFKLCLPILPRIPQPSIWAASQGHLGYALFRLSLLQDDVENVTGAIDALNHYFSEFTAEQDPNEWARAQIHLGNSYWKLSEHKFDLEYIDKAASAFRAASEVASTRDGALRNLAELSRRIRPRGFMVF